MSGKSRFDHIEGPNLVLRLIRLEDAEYVHALRMDTVYNRYLSEVRGSTDDQRRWIETYKTREAEGREYYYVIERRDGVRCGLVRLYDIGTASFTWGSWILDGNKTPKAALESAVLSFGVGFNALNLAKALVDVRVENQRAVAFYRRFGMVQIDETERDIFFIYPRARFEVDCDRYFSILSSVSSDV